MNDRDTRREFWRRRGTAIDELLVWKDIDQTYEYTEGVPSRLCKWEKLTEYLKLQVGFMVAISLGGYSFTSRIHPTLEGKWVASGRLQANIAKRLREQLARSGVANIEYAYILEARTKSGKSRTDIHLHGYALADDPLDITRFKVAVEKALHQARGQPPLGKKAWREDRAYDKDTGDGRGYGRWVGYITKNTSRFDHRIRGRRVHISQSLTKTARVFWEFLRDDV